MLDAAGAIVTLATQLPWPLGTQVPVPASHSLAASRQLAPDLQQALWSTPQEMVDRQVQVWRVQLAAATALVQYPE